MSKRRAPTIADLATGAAGGRRVVLSAGTLDGPMLAALQRLNLLKNVEDSLSAASTWGDGVTTANAQSQMPEPSDNPFSQMPKGGAKHGDSTD